ncbi:MAG TPA: hypothetical protein VFK05_31475 [Polyangiaceae bacterium]|nr:hypothetical protein [Polyangiaceae bacterium]
MTKSAIGYWMFAALGILAQACGNDAPKDSPCKTGAEACLCYANKTCDAGLSCLGTLCIDLSGIAGSGSVLGGGGEPSSIGASGAADIGDAGAANGGASAGGASSAAAGSSSDGGSISSGGSIGHGGALSSGGSTAAAGAGGAGQLFPPNPAGCARVTSCPTCCDTSGVFALNSLSVDATSKYVTAFNVDSSAASAEFEFATSDEVGAIFFHFSTPQSIGALSIAALAVGGALEIALVRATGKDGCIYPVVGSSLSSIPSSCWGLGAGPYAALPADQIEVRVRSLSSGRAALNVSSVQYAP